MESNSLDETIYYSCLIFIGNNLSLIKYLNEALNIFDTLSDKNELEFTKSNK